MGQHVVIRGGWTGIEVNAVIANVDAENKFTTKDGRTINLRHLCYINGDYGLKSGDSGSAVVDKKTKALVGIFLGTTHINNMNVRQYFSAAVLPRKR